MEVLTLTINADEGRPPADVVLVIDSDVPWIPAVSRPSDDAAVYYVDVDPLKVHIQLWHAPTRLSATVNSKGRTAPGRCCITAAARWGGQAARPSVDFHASLEPEVDLPGVALAAGAGFGATVSDPVELPQVLKDALAVVHGGRSAVVSVRLPSV